MIYLGYSCKYLAFTQYYSSKHKAIDIANTVTVGSKKHPNTYVYMAYEGKIVKNQYASDYGYYVEYEIKDGKDTYLIASGHFDTKSSLVVGKTYPRGTVINKMGSKGSNSTGKHDHFRVTKNGVRIDPIEVCYGYTDWNIQGSKEKAKLKWYTPVIITPTVERDTTKDQLMTNTTLNVRAGAGTNFKSIGSVKAKSIYNYYEIKDNGGYKWYRIADNQWLAQDKENSYLTIYEKEDAELIEELKKEIETLKIRIAELEADIIKKDKLILEQKAKIQELENRTWLSMLVEWLKKLFNKN